ncbi:YtxH domain-containing protein [Rathayibacter sp. KR2-224]|uniref:YtxH domain-containing protein n=1 Tax=Rathayibacter sp. KR2-224 TaxID=3400913 RepID=UPI003C077C82
MKGKVLFVVGLGTGYVLGTRAGRQRYEQIKSVWLKLWDSPAVQKQVHTVQDYAADRIGDLGTVVTENIKRIVTKSVGSQSSSKGPKTAGGTASGESTGPASGSVGPVGGEAASEATGPGGQAS